MPSVAVAGASGYMGAELLRLLTVHPKLELTAVTSERLSGERLDLSALLDANFGQGNNADGLDQEKSAAITAQVDNNAPSAGAHFEDTIVLAGYGTSNADIVRAVFNASEQQLSS